MYVLNEKFVSRYLHKGYCIAGAASRSNWVKDTHKKTSIIG